MEFLAQIGAHELVRNALSTIVVVAVAILARASALRLVRRLNLPPVDARRWIVQIRNATVIVIIFGLVIFWAAELRTVALSLVAIAAAVVIATKEIISCVTGGILRTSAKSFSIGDRIEIADFRGDVVDQSLLTTTIFEIGPGPHSHQYTGRAVTLPNSVFLTTPVINESYTDEFVLHLFTIPMRRDADWRSAEAALLKAANEECADFLEQAKRHMDRLSRSRGLEAPSVEPRVSLLFEKPDEIHLLARVPTPARRKGRVEQAILRRFASYWAKA